MLLLVAAMLVAPGCSSVKTTQPLSSNPEPIDQDKFEGVWLLDDSVVHVQFSSNGVAKIAGLEWEDDRFQINRAEAIVTKGNKHNFISLRCQEDDGKWDGYYFLPYKFTHQGDLVLWPPVPGAFEGMIEKKKLQGIVKKDEYTTAITITNAPARLLEVIDDPDNLNLFNYREPTILKKVAEND